MLNFVKTPPPFRSIKGRHSPIFETEEWQDLVMALGAGLKPQEYIEIELPQGHPLYGLMKNPTNSFHFNVKKKLKELGLPYDCYVRSHSIYVVGRGVLS
jgi:hypothetical protein